MNSDEPRGPAHELNNTNAVREITDGLGSGRSDSKLHHPS